MTCGCSARRMRPSRGRTRPTGALRTAMASSRAAGSRTDRAWPSRCVGRPRLASFVDTHECSVRAVLRAVCCEEDRDVAQLERQRKQPPKHVPVLPAQYDTSAAISLSLVHPSSPYPPSSSFTAQARPTPSPTAPQRAPSCSSSPTLSLPLRGRFHHLSRHPHLHTRLEQRPPQARRRTRREATLPVTTPSPVSSFSRSHTSSSPSPSQSSSRTATTRSSSSTPTPTAATRACPTRRAPTASTRTSGGSRAAPTSSSSPSAPTSRPCRTRPCPRPTTTTRTAAPSVPASA
jgi:hypothetical protein